MNSSYSALMQSKFFTPAFNSAIFDGPVRVYFAQIHESFALKVYFLIQQEWAQELLRAKSVSKATGANILLMIYPTEESYQLAAQSSGPWGIDKWNEDLVITLCMPLEENDLKTFIQYCGEQMQKWQPQQANAEVLGPVFI